MVRSDAWDLVLRPAWAPPGILDGQFAESQEKGDRSMTAKAYKKIEIVGTSPQSFSDAVSHAVQKASETVRHCDWFEVVEQRGRIVDGKVQEFQATIRIGFRLD